MPNELGEFLRSRRARISPEQAGLAPGIGHRRVPGLRREEVALLAGVSVDYYVHLEQGRTAHVSDAVLDDVAQVLNLTDTEREHLGNLARPHPDRSPAGPQRVPVATRQLLDLLDVVPALVHGRRMEVHAANEAARAVFGTALTTPGTSSARAFFLDQGAREVYLNWDAVAADIVGHLRLEAGRHPDDRKLATLVGELSMKSESFRALWARRDVRRKTTGLTRLVHPMVGELELTYQVLALPDQVERALITYNYGRGTLTEERLRFLLSWNAPASSAAESDATPSNGVSDRD